MRRTASFVMIVACGLSFVVVCLGACFAPVAAADHACCEGEEGWQAAGSDCCSVMPAISEGGAVVASAAAQIVAPPTPTLFVTTPSLTAGGPVVAAPSPPLILRI